MSETPTLRLISNNGQTIPEKSELITEMPAGLAPEGVTSNLPSRDTIKMSADEFYAKGGNPVRVLGHPANPSTQLAESLAPAEGVESTEWSEPKLSEAGHVALEGIVEQPAPGQDAVPTPEEINGQ